MSMSLRDQLLKAGLVNEKQAKQATKQKQKQQRLEHKNQVDKDDSQRQAAEQAKAEKLARDQELNRQQQEKAEKKGRSSNLSKGRACPSWKATTTTISSTPRRSSGSRSTT